MFRIIIVQPTPSYSMEGHNAMRSSQVTLEYKHEELIMFLCNTNHFVVVIKVPDRNGAKLGFSTNVIALSFILRFVHETKSFTSIMTQPHSKSVQPLPFMVKI